MEFADAEEWLEECRRYYGGKRNGSGVIVHCPNPSHPDKHPSCSLSVRNGVGVYHCYSGCARQDVSAALERDRLSPPRTKRHRRQRQDGAAGRVRIHNGAAGRVRIANGEDDDPLAKAAAKAEKVWRTGSKRKDPYDHPYLKKKKVRKVARRADAELRIDKESNLLVPYRHARTDRLLGVLRISPDGTKLTAEGTKASGGIIWTIPGKDDSGPLYVAEGTATGLSVRAATGGMTASVGGKGNMLKAVKLLRQRWPNRRIVVCADPPDGINKAREAAAVIGNASLAVPQWPDGDRDKFDFNDLHVEHGKEAVREQLEQAQPVEPAETDTESDVASLAQADIILDVVLEHARELFLDDHGAAHATLKAKRGHLETWAVRSHTFRSRVLAMAYNALGKAPGTEILTTVLNTLEAKAAEED